MLKEKLAQIRDYILKHYKLVFPLILVACVAVTVTLALHANSSSEVDDIINDTSQSVTDASGTTDEVGLNSLNTEVALKQNDIPEIWTLVCTYYNAIALGDLETIKSVCDQVSETELLRIEEMAKYIDSYPSLEVYTKEGMEAGSTVMYVYYKVVFSSLDAQFPALHVLYACTRDDGSLYIKSEWPEELAEYIQAVSAQDDVVELKNKTEVEYSELIQNDPQTLLYLTELDAEVGKAVGERLAQMNASETTEPTEGEQSPEGEAGTETTPTEEAPTEEAPEITIMYAEATATVNVRSSDSEQADKLGKAAKGTTLQILEQGVNGWTKVSFEGKEGYIKSEYLNVLENADDQVVIGTVTATANVNVRSKASTSAERLGVLKGGDKVDLLATENGWCKIKYNGRVGYVNADYVQ